MDSAPKIVEHFFRHEYGRIVALLTRSLGTRHLNSIEDWVQSAMSRALATWPRTGIPADPAAWLYRTARNLANDSFRRERIADQVLSSPEVAQEQAKSTSEPSIHFEDEVGDETLRLLFLCCHPAIPAESRVALALKTVSGFSIPEIANALLTTHANAEKRVHRAKQRLQSGDLTLTELNNAAVSERLETVRSTIYLIFNEGFAATQGTISVRQDLCEEAIRLANMLAQHPICQSPSTFALLALLRMHAARLYSRIDSQGDVVLLADQDRTLWDWAMIREAMSWMERSATGDQLSRYHIEATIAWEHCRAVRWEETDWQRVTECYELLLQHFPTPMIRLNHAISISYLENVQRGRTFLLAIPDADRKRLRPWWDCAMAQMFQRESNTRQAISHWRDGLALAQNGAHRTFIESQLKKLEAV